MCLIWTLIAGCGPTRQPLGIAPSAIAVGPCENLTVNISPPGDDLYYTGGRIHLSAAVGHVIAFQLVLKADAGPVMGIELFGEDLTASLDSTVSASQPASRPAAEPNSTAGFAISLFREWPVTVDQFPTWYLRSVGRNERRIFTDALVPVTAPINGQPFALSPNGTLPIWVELRIPQLARPGSYQTAINVRSASAQPLRIPIDLAVRDVYVPPEKKLPMLARVDLGPIIATHSNADSKNIRAALSDTDARHAIIGAFKALHAHGLSPYTDQVKPVMHQEIDGKLSIDWSNFDSFCGPLIDGSAYEDGRPAIGWPLPVDLEQPEPVQYDGLDSPAYAAVLRDYLAACKSHFAEKGWRGENWLWMDVAPGPNPTAQQLKALHRIADIAHADNSIAASAPAVAPTTSSPITGMHATPRKTLISTLIPQSMVPFGWRDHHFEDVSQDVDIWAMPTRYYDRLAMRRQRAGGKKIWLRPEREPFGATLSIVAPRGSATAFAWQAFVADCDAALLLGASSWPERVFDTPLTNRQLPDDAWLLYPGDSFGLNEPIPSIRLKLLQLGLQDAQLLQLLTEQGRAETAKLLAGSLIKAIGTQAYGDNFMDAIYSRRQDDARTWQLARDLLLEETASVVAERPDENMDVPGNRSKWTRFLAATRHVTVTPESTRLIVRRRTPGESSATALRPHTILKITHEIAVLNELRMEIAGDLRLATLPIGASAVNESARIGPLAEMGLMRKDVSWELNGPLPCDLDGHYTQRIVFDAGKAGETATEAVMSVVQAPPSGHPITIDGNLSDWLPNEFNAAGDFRLITFATTARPDEEAALRGAASRRPRAASQTVAFFCRDTDALYIALHAASPRDRESSAEAKQITSEVIYEDLAPVGEDLVEILIDPTNHGTLSDELYHLIIKSNGIGIFEKGIGITPRIGKQRAWPGPNPRYAVVKTDFGWSAEIAIPLAAFGEGATRNGAWGLNIARAEPTRGEYSDWARAPRYCYDPRTLGNLIWPE